MKIMLPLLVMLILSMTNLRSQALDTLSNLTDSILFNSDIASLPQPSGKPLVTFPNKDSAIVDHLAQSGWQLIHSERTVVCTEVAPFFNCTQQAMFGHYYLMDGNLKLEVLFPTEMEVGLLRFSKPHYFIAEDLNQVVKSYICPLYVGNQTSRYLVSRYAFKRKD